MSGGRPLLRSPEFGDGMTSDTIEESGVKLIMFALPLGMRRASGRFELVLSGTCGRGGIGQINRGAELRMIRG
jgi:hypothetical protein